MRSLVMTASFVAMTLCAIGPTPLSAQESSAGHRIAIVDVAKIFKEHKGIRAQIAQVENDAKSFDAALKQRRDAMTQAAAQLKELKVGSPDYTAKEEQLAEMDSKLRLDITRKRKELQEAESRIYFENYQRIAAGVKYLANYYKVNLVLRYNSEEMEQERGETVLRGVMKNIVYYDENLDMTGAVMQYLDKVLQANGGSNVR